MRQRRDEGQEVIYGETSENPGDERLSYLDGVAVDGLSSARHVHCFGDLQDVVWHVAGRPAAATNLPPLLPVVEDLTDERQGSDNLFHQ